MTDYQTEDAPLTAQALRSWVPRYVDPRDPNGMTILTALDTGDGPPVMAKTWSPTADGPKPTSYDLAWLFQSRTVSVASFLFLVALLSTMKSRTHACVIRGALLPSADPDRTVRRSRERDGRPPTFEDCPRCWILLDFDKFSPADFPDPRNAPDSCIRAVRERLPHELQNVACFWSFSSSTGVRTSKLGVHCWFLLGRPVAWPEAKAIIAACGADDAMSRPVQVHYTASPLFQAPLTDPLPTRFGYLPGLPKVPAESVDALVEAGRKTMERVALKKEMKDSAWRQSFAPTRWTHRKPEEGDDRAIPVEGKIGDGFRHDHLVSIAGFCRSRGLEADDLDVVIAAENANNCSPPLADEEVSRMAQSFGRYPLTDDVQQRPDYLAIAVMAGLCRHHACRESILVAGARILGDESRAIALHSFLGQLPDWQRQVVERYPDLAGWP